MLGWMEATIAITLIATGVSQEAKPKPSESHAWDSLVTKLDVQERSYLLLWKSSDEGLVLLDHHLEQYPDSPHREEAVYLKAVGLWGLFRYEDAADAYAVYLKAYPDQQRSNIAMTRQIQSLIRSDQPEAALQAVEAYASQPAGQQRSLSGVNALALQGKVQEAKTQLQKLITVAENDPRAARMITMLQDQMKQLDWIGKPLKDFSVKAWKTGETLSPATFKGRVLLVEFWASWCRPCVSQMPHIVDVYRQHHQQGFDILGVNLDEQAVQMQAAMERLGVTWPQYNDAGKWTNLLVTSFGVHRIPFSILVDQDGVVRYVNPPSASLDRLVPELLGDTAPATSPPTKVVPGSDPG